MTIARVTQQSGEILAALARVIVGKADVLERILAGILANGHVLIEDYPGLAKTLIARLFAQALNLSFKRLQCTPDLLPSDVTGSFLFDQREARFEAAEPSAREHVHVDAAMLLRRARDGAQPAPVDVGIAHQLVDHAIERVRPHQRRRVNDLGIGRGKDAVARAVFG